jgi:aryl-alcohol dehydrogenase-like predicted oxidoreductase/histidinol phosphatase-like enzyme/predicted kinase
MAPAVTGGGPLVEAPALGAMRLSTAPDRDDEASIGLLHEAFDAGVRLVDTADAYARDETEIGHNERLVARALASWSGERSLVTVATKGGLTRPGGEWVADGRARSLVAACEASRRALGVERIALYQLHVPDPKVPLATSVRALARLKREGLVERVGLSNVTVGQVREAETIVEIASVQVEMSPWRDASLLSGVAEHCRDRGIPLLAYRPLGGPERRARVLEDPVLRAVAERHGAAPADIVLSWLRDLSPVVVPLAGATRAESVRSIVRAWRIVLRDEDRIALDERFPAGRLLREGPRATRPRPPAGGGEIVLVMGLPAAGKSTVARGLADAGYLRLNRDEAGGAVGDLLPALERHAREGGKRFVMDNTYVSRQSRRPVLEKGRALGLPVRVVWLATPIEEAQVNAVSRIVERYGRLLDPGEIRRLGRKDPAVFPPSAQFRMKRLLEPPGEEEGFSRVDVARFERLRDPARDASGLFTWCEDVLARSRAGKRAPVSPDDVEIVPGRAPILRRHADAGFRLVGLSWRPDVAEGATPPERVDAVHERIRSALDVPIEFLYCPHPAGPPLCWCRKPLPGLPVAAIFRHRIDVAKSVYVGRSTGDAALARRLGLDYRDATEFFAS